MKLLIAVITLFVASTSIAQDMCNEKNLALDALEQQLHVESGIENLDSIYLIGPAVESDRTFSFTIFDRFGEEFKNGGLLSTYEVNKANCLVSQLNTVQLSPFK